MNKVKYRLTAAEIRNANWVDEAEEPQYIITHGLPNEIRVAQLDDNYYLMIYANINGRRFCYWHNPDNGDSGWVVTDGENKYCTDGNDYTYYKPCAVELVNEDGEVVEHYDEVSFLERLTHYNLGSWSDEETAKVQAVADWVDDFYSRGGKVYIERTDFANKYDLHLIYGGLEYHTNAPKFDKDDELDKQDATNKLALALITYNGGNNLARVYVDGLDDGEAYSYRVVDKDGDVIADDGDESYTLDEVRKYAREALTEQGTNAHTVEVYRRAFGYEEISDGEWTDHTDYPKADSEWTADDFAD